MPLLVSQVVMRMEFAEAVALVFALAASTFCPLLVLGIWWRGLTPPGAVAGVATGGVLAGAAIVLSLGGYERRPACSACSSSRPAIVSVPAAFLRDGRRERRDRDGAARSPPTSSSCGCTLPSGWA